MMWCCKPNLCVPLPKPNRQDLSPVSLRSSSDRYTTLLNSILSLQNMLFVWCYHSGSLSILLCNIIPNKNMCTKVRLKGDSYKGENIKANLAAMVSRSSLSCGSSGPFIDHCSSLMFMSFNIRSPSSSQ